MPKWSFLKKKEEPDLQQEREREREHISEGWPSYTDIPQYYRGLWQ
jgi:hypothetical protein